MRRIAAVAVGLQLALPAIADDLPIRPDPKLKPGAVLTTDVATVCQPGCSKTVRHTSGKLKALIYREYGIDHASGHFEIDHLIPLELGGGDVADNLWVESFDTMPWNAHVKDRLEDRLHALVCAGKLPIEQAQQEIATDWIATYEKYLGKPDSSPSRRPLTSTSGTRRRTAKYAGHVKALPAAIDLLIVRRARPWMARAPVISLAFAFAFSLAPIMPLALAPIGIMALIGMPIAVGIIPRLRR
jgi:hypothetical protein